MIRVAVLTISDKASAGSREDRSGPAVTEAALRRGWEVIFREVLPDEADRISRRLAALAERDEADVILTTGGTGVAARDVTPEATRAVLDREIPGIGEVMRASGRTSTRYAVLSRATAGTRGRSVIVNLPGSPQGAVEALESVAELLPHVVELLRGKTEH